MSKINISIFYQSLKKTFWSWLGTWTLIKLFSVVILAVSLLVPSGLYLLKTNGQMTWNNIQQQSQIAVFLPLNIKEIKAKKLQSKIQLMPEVVQVDYISPEQALSIFKAESGLGQQLDQLGKNILPITLFVQGKKKQTASEILALAKKLKTFPEVERVSLDSYWTEKTLTLLSVVKQVYLFFIIAFSLVFIGTTFFVIRVSIQELEDEIQLKLLLGATHHALKAQFIKVSFILSLLSVLLSVLITNLGVAILKKPLVAFSQEFGVSFDLNYLGLIEIVAITVTAILLGILTAWITCDKKLKKMEKELETVR